MISNLAPFEARLVSQAEDASIVSESLTVLDCKRGTCGNITVGAGGYETTYFGKPCQTCAACMLSVECLGIAFHEPNSRQLFCR
jgi:hypothetical protein